MNGAPPRSAPCRLAVLLRADAVRWHVMGLVAALNLPQGCIGAGFIRNMVWDHLHGRHSDCRAADIDVLYFDADRPDPQRERRLEAALAAQAPGFRWSVRNQARMHRRNGDSPYGSVADAMRHWPETATAIAAHRTGAHSIAAQCTLIAPFGTADLFGLILRPASANPAKLAAFRSRMERKRWRERWPGLRVAPPYPSWTGV